MISRWFDRLFSAILPTRDKQGLRWELEADYAVIDQEPLRARALLYLGGLVLACLFIWSAVTELEEVNRGEARVIPSGQIQIIQAVDGGVVSEIAVVEGQTVAKGQLMLKIDPTRFISSWRENRSQYLALLIKAERLKALSDKRSFTPPEEVVKADPTLVAQELTLFSSSRNELKAQLNTATEKLQQRTDELREKEAQFSQLKLRLKLLEQELRVTKPLLKSGAVSEVELLRLEREVIQVHGEHEQVAAQIDQAHSAIAESRGKSKEIELSFFNRIRRELFEVQAKLGSLTEEQTTLADRVKQTGVKSPVPGIVKRLQINTLGAVVQPGQELVEIVPSDDTLILEVKINPKDIAFLRPGLKAQVKFTAYDYSMYGSMAAEVEQIGADTITDERGNSFYLIRVRTQEAQLGEDLPIIPGMLAQVDIITGKKSLLTYMLKPILKAKAMAFRER